MRIDGKRASQFSQMELVMMLANRESPSGANLTENQLREVRKTFNLRKEKEKTNE